MWYQLSISRNVYWEQISTVNWLKLVVRNFKGLWYFTYKECFNISFGWLGSVAFVCGYMDEDVDLYYCYG